MDDVVVRRGDHDQDRRRAVRKRVSLGNYGLFVLLAGVRTEDGAVALAVMLLFAREFGGLLSWSMSVACVTQ